LKKERLILPPEWRTLLTPIGEGNQDLDVWELLQPRRVREDG